MIEVDTSLSGKRVTEALERAVKAYGLPKVLCVDNGPEFAGRALDHWAHQRKVKLRFSRPGKPTDNAMIETFNAKVHLECLDQNWFESLEEARWCLEQWRREYNQERPHSALANQTPAEFVASWRHEHRLKKPQPDPLGGNVFGGRSTDGETLHLSGITLACRSTQQVFDPDGKKAMDFKAYREIVTIPIPAGQDGKVWSVGGPYFGIFLMRFYNVPNAVASTPSDLMVPRESAIKDNLKILKP